MAGNDVDDGWVYLDGDQDTKASGAPVPAPAVVFCPSEGLDEPALDLELLAGLDYLTRKKASRIRMDVPDDSTEVVATAAVVGDGESEDVGTAEDEGCSSNYSSQGCLEKAYESDQDLDHVADESEHEQQQHGTSDLRLRGLLDNLNSIESKLLACQRELLDCLKSIQDHRKATRDEAAPAPAPAPSAHHYDALRAAITADVCAPLYRGGVYDGKSSGYGYRSGGYGTSSGYGYRGGGYEGGLSDYDYGGGRGGYYRGISGYDYGGLGYYYSPGIFNSKYGYGGGGGYGIGSGYRLGGGGGYDIGCGYRFGGCGGYGGIADYGYRYGRSCGYYSDFDYGGGGYYTMPSSTMPEAPAVEPEALP